MDPNKTLEEIMHLVVKILFWRHPEDHHGETLAELGKELAQKVSDLDSWLEKGGFIPQAWMRYRA